MKSLIAACAACGVKNRIPVARQYHGPRCGKCGREMDLAGVAVPIELGDSDLVSFVATSKLPVMVDFFSPNCGPCRSLAPLIDTLTRRFFHQVAVAKIDTLQYAVSASRYGISAVPTLLFFRNGTPVDRIVGVPPESQLIRSLEKLAAVKAA